MMDERYQYIEVSPQLRRPDHFSIRTAPEVRRIMGSYLRWVRSIPQAAEQEPLTYEYNPQIWHLDPDTEQDRIRTNLDSSVPFLASLYAVTMGIALGNMPMQGDTTPEKEQARIEALFGFSQLLEMTEQTGRGNIPWRPIQPKRQDSGKIFDIEARREANLARIRFDTTRQRLSLQWFERNPVFRVPDFSSRATLVAQADSLLDSPTSETVQWDTRMSAGLMAWGPAPDGTLVAARTPTTSLLNNNGERSLYVRIANGAYGDAEAAQISLMKTLHVYDYFASYLK